jgi:hypothetical protein
VSRVPLSAVVTTFNNAATLDACLASLALADDAGADSGSRTASRSPTARRAGAGRGVQGIGPQKQSAIDQAAHDALLLDADEAGRPAPRRW